jgi:hypothetical protein
MTMNRKALKIIIHHWPFKGNASVAGSKRVACIRPRVSPQLMDSGQEEELHLQLLIQIKHAANNKS